MVHLSFQESLQVYLNYGYKKYLRNHVIDYKRSSTFYIPLLCQPTILVVSKFRTGQIQLVAWIKMNSFNPIVVVLMLTISGTVAEVSPMQLKQVRLNKILHAYAVSACNNSYAGLQ